MSSKRDHFVLDCFTSLNSADGFECRHFPVNGHPAERVQLADEVVTADANSMQGEQMPVETTENGDEVAGVHVSSEFAFIFNSA